jgi:hypothetical protein
MGNATGHLSDGAQAFVLHRGLLCPVQVIVSLRNTPKLRVVSSAGDMFAQLPEELTVSAAKLHGAQRTSITTPNTWPSTSNGS